ncbi:MAG TPA: amidase family protein [Jatrophihabitantaceae bacterium]|nr:amidase family protein [Jatrophihabitantaceae bacterium]
MTESAAEIAASVRSGTLSARSAVEAALNRIAERDPQLGAFQLVRAEAALREADAVDAHADRAELPLAGVPVAIKDNVPVAGEPMRIGSAGSDPAPQQRDHAIVARLREAGAVVVGLTAVPELCVFAATDSTFGTTRNPWNPAHTPGGSSGGSAAAVAAGLVPVAHGNDGMGSIRIPAACCGLVGIKPGFGLVPSALGSGGPAGARVVGGEDWFGMAENGPLTTTVADAALMLSVLAGRPDLATLGEPGTLRIAVSTKAPMPGTPVDREWADATRRTADVLRGAGHSVRDANPPYGQVVSTSGIVRWTAGTELDARTLADRSKLAPRTRRHAALGALALRAGLPHEKGRTNWQRRAAAFFDGHDVLLTPALAQSPIASARWSERGWFANVWSNARYAPFAAPWNLAGWPAMAVPAGVTATGLPVSVQLVARPGGEALLFALAAQLEQLQPWPRLAPDYR